MTWNAILYLDKGLTEKRQIDFVPRKGELIFYLQKTFEVDVVCWNIDKESLEDEGFYGSVRLEIWLKPRQVNKKTGKEAPEA